jgi:hypothetical protein
MQNDAHLSDLMNASGIASMFVENGFEVIRLPPAPEAAWYLSGRKMLRFQLIDDMYCQSTGSSLQGRNREGR